MSKELIINNNQIGDYLNKVKGSLQGYYGDKQIADFLRSALMLISEKNELKECLKTDYGQSTLLHALKYAATTKLSLNPQEGKAALIAYGGKVQYQIMKNGLIELAMESGKVDFITCDTVRSADDFKIVKTMDGDRYEYSPARKNRGDIDGFFSAVKLKDGTCHVKYMTKKEVEDHRDAYSSLFKAKPDMSPWLKSFEGMGLKTVLKANFRNLAVSPEIDKAVGIDDNQEIEKDPGLRDVTEPVQKGATAEEIKDKLTEPKSEEKPVKQDDKGELF